MNLIRLTLLLIMALPATVRAEPGFVVQPIGQATNSTCQSYALGVALAFKRDAQFKLTTAADLRKTELAIRAAIKSAAGTESVNHDHIKKGFESFTNGIYKLKFRVVDLAQVGEEVKKRSGVTSPVPLEFLLGAIVKDVVLASATMIDNYPYSQGHIFTLLGADGPPNSNQKLLILNSAIKVKGIERNSCSEDLPDDPGPYTAGLSWKDFNSIKFKVNSPGKVLLWTIEK